MFTPLKKNDDRLADRPISNVDVYPAWVKYADSLGLASKPHDARRTLIIEVIRRADEEPLI